ncbi:uncharacterized protein B0H18DRAFT_1051902 [Fomitopsis serialis]|uniref:uncharacterized protein n=1 Tax=Fomitopsis serialis TaxID=139415 RepID=UPI002008B9B9|nr:uncharacterized protein B0H18DRAFT_1051902 [Neoantrodia serialis]KAH9912802.1 hypothetical protein B0H18DRAFT_1051902 [Neoantrodia serialis]
MVDGVEFSHEDASPASFPFHLLSMSSGIVLLVADYSCYTTHWDLPTRPRTQGPGFETDSSHLDKDLRVVSNNECLGYTVVCMSNILRV